MKENQGNIEKRLKEVEEQMSKADFWGDKERAQAVIKEYNELKERRAGGGKYDAGNAIVTIFSGAGGDDAEDFSRMLFDMYAHYAENKGWGVSVLHKNENTHGGYRNITFEVAGKNLPARGLTASNAQAGAQAGVYGMLKNESGVHRLVRISPFSAKKLRHTSFSMVEVVPELPKGIAIDIPESDIEVEFARSSGPGGQNVNKRETAVRIVHLPTKVSVHVESERTQERNREKALEILKGKLARQMEEKQMEEEAGYKVSKTTEAEWGSQIRSYVLHPYQMVKDHRTGVEVRDIDAVFERGELDKFIDAEKEL